MKPKRIYLILQAAACILLVLLLSFASVSILREGTRRKAENPRESVYTREIISEKWKPIAPLFYASLGLLAVGIVLGIRDENADKPVKNQHLYKKTDGKPKKQGIWQAAVVVAAVILIIAGVFNQSARDVLYKAISICTECVGLG